MASDISIGEQYLFVSNRRLKAMIGFVMEVAQHRASSDTENEFVAKLKRWDEKEHYPGASFDLNERFPTVDEKKFWTECFRDSARWIFQRKIGNQDIEFWQVAAIGDAYITSRLLAHAIREFDRDWSPETEDGQEFDDYYEKLNIQN